MAPEVNCQITEIYQHVNNMLVLYYFRYLYVMYVVQIICTDIIFWCICNVHPRKEKMTGCLVKKMLLKQKGHWFNRKRHYF